MRRTQIYLTDEEWKALQEARQKEGVSMSALIRQAIDEYYLKRRPGAFRKALAEVAGMWADREDLGSTEEYVRNLRQDTRPERFWKK